MTTIDFRGQSERHFALSKRHFDNSEYDAFPAACLELRMAVECLAFQLLQSFEDEVTIEKMEVWQASKLIKDLKEIDDSVDRDSITHIGKEDGPDGAVTEMQLLAKQNRLSGKWVGKCYSALGSFVHEPSIAQQRQAGPNFREKAKASYLQAVIEVERVLSNSCGTFSMWDTFNYRCDCGYLISRREALVEKDGKLRCPNCRKIYRRSLVEGQWTIRRSMMSAPCPVDTCQHSNFVPEEDVVEDGKATCERCGKQMKFKSQLCIVAD